MGRHRKPTRKAVHFARIAVGGVILAEVTGGLPAIPAEAATPPRVYTASPVLAVHAEKLHKHHHQNKHHAVAKTPAVAPAAALAVAATPAATAAVDPAVDPDMGFLFDHYTVRDGDTLTHIAAAFNLPWEVLYSANGDVLDHPDNLQIGQVLRLPA